MLRYFWITLGLAACAPNPTDACLDVTGAFTDKAVECGVDEAAAAESALSIFVDGSCDNVLDLRDSRELLKTCIPWIEDLSCDQFMDTSLAIDPSCQGQLLYE